MVSLAARDQFWKLYLILSVILQLALVFLRPLGTSFVVLPVQVLSQLAGPAISEMLQSISERCQC